MRFIVEQAEAGRGRPAFFVQSVSAATGTAFRSLVPGTSFQNDPVLFSFLFTPTTSESEVLVANRSPSDLIHSHIFWTPAENRDKRNAASCHCSGLVTLGHTYYHELAASGGREPPPVSMITRSPGGFKLLHRSALKPL